MNHGEERQLTLEALTRLVQAQQRQLDELKGAPRSWRRFFLRPTEWLQPGGADADLVAAGVKRRGCS